MGLLKQTKDQMQNTCLTSGILFLNQSLILKTSFRDKRKAGEMSSEIIKLLVMRSNHIIYTG